MVTYWQPEMSDDGGPDCEDILQRHRREKRLLHAQTLALKKSAGKMDKKKKKELNETISRLESELERTHMRELSEFESANEQRRESVESSQPDDDAPARISKAQRRRDKKATEEALRQKRIKETVHTEGPDVIETRALEAELKKYDLTIHQVSPDGDCLYSAISHQLLLRCKTMTVDELRRSAADYILKHRDDFAPFMCDANTGDSLSEEQFIKYCDDVINTKSWGGQVELQALSSVLNRTIEVVQQPNRVVVGCDFFKNGEPLVITYHRHMYGLGEHYNSTRKVIDNVDSSVQTTDFQ